MHGLTVIQDISIRSNDVRKDHIISSKCRSQLSRQTRSKLAKAACKIKYAIILWATFIPLHLSTYR